MEYAQCKHKSKQEQQAKDARIKPGRGGKGGGGEVVTYYLSKLMRWWC